MMDFQEVEEMDYNTEQRTQGEKGTEEREGEKGIEERGREWNRGEM